MRLTKPPAAAEALLELLLPADSRETVSGDLLEEYREDRLPTGGRLRANLWYVRQVVEIFLRTYWAFSVPLVLLLVTHDLFNTFRDPSGASYLDRLPRLSVPAPLLPMLLFTLVGAYGSRRTGRWVGGLVAALGTFLVVWGFMAFWWSATVYPFAQFQQTNPYWTHAWQWSTHRPHPPTYLGYNPDSPQEGFLRWIVWDNVGALIVMGVVMLLTSAVCGSLGGTLGRFAKPSPQE